MSINGQLESESVSNNSPIDEESNQIKSNTHSNMDKSLPPSDNLPSLKKYKKKKVYRLEPLTLALCLIISILGGILGGSLYSHIFPNTSSEKISLADGTSSAEIKNSNILSSAEVVNLVANSVVDIATESSKKSSDNKSYVSISAGSGIVYSSDGYIITNEHIINDNNKITVTLKNGNSYSATLINSDSNNDIALLKINANNLSPVIFGNSDNLKLGEETTVIGNPLGELSGTVTDGVVSAINRVVTVEGHEMSLLQTSAEINSGNSGGGVFRRTGELIGVVIAKSSGDDIEGLGFAIPSNTVRSVVEKFKK